MKGLDESDSDQCFQPLNQCTILSKIHWSEIKDISPIDPFCIFSEKNEIDSFVSS